MAELSDAFVMLPGRLRHLRGVHGVRDLGAAGHPRQALRDPQRRRLLRPAARPSWATPWSRASSRRARSTPWRSRTTSTSCSTPSSARRVIRWRPGRARPIRPRRWGSSAKTSQPTAASCEPSPASSHAWAGDGSATDGCDDPVDGSTSSSSGGMAAGPDGGEAPQARARRRHQWRLTGQFGGRGRGPGGRPGPVRRGWSSAEGAGPVP